MTTGGGSGFTFTDDKNPFEVSGICGARVKCGPADLRTDQRVN